MRSLETDRGPTVPPGYAAAVSEDNVAIMRAILETSPTTSKGEVLQAIPARFQPDAQRIEAAGRMVNDEAAARPALA